MKLFYCVLLLGIGAGCTSAKEGVPFPAYRFVLTPPCVEIFGSGTYDDMAHHALADTSYGDVTLICNFGDVTHYVQFK